MDQMAALYCSILEGKFTSLLVAASPCKMLATLSCKMLAVLPSKNVCIVTQQKDVEWIISGGAGGKCSV